MSKNNYIAVFLLAFSMLPFFSQAQNTMREVGLRVSTNVTNLNPSFIYKKQVSENVYKRYNFAFANLNLSNNNKTGNNFGAHVSTSLGKEKRRDIGNRLKFIHGLQYFGGFGMNYQEMFTLNAVNANIKTTQTRVNANLGLGYLLGVHFELSPAFYVNLEVTPNAYVNYQSETFKGEAIPTNTNRTVGLQAEYSNGVVVNLVYCFAKK